MMYDIKPYERAGDLYFRMGRDGVVRHLGVPERIGKRSKEVKYFYEDLCVCFSDDMKRIVEITFYPSANVAFDGILVYSDPDAFKKLLIKDGNPLEDVGIIFLLNLGINLTGFHDDQECERAITIYERGRFDDCLTKLKPFQ